jgi:hypothetical protein
MPDDRLIAAMTKYNEEMAEAGILLDLAGLQPSSKGARIKFSDGRPTIVDGPFAETKELIAGYWISLPARQSRTHEGSKPNWRTRSNQPAYIEMQREPPFADGRPPSLLAVSAAK